jgi:tellurite resistance protein
MEFFGEVHVDERAAEAIARGLYVVAKCDGVHEREAALVASFYSEIRGSGRALSELERMQDITSAELSAALPQPEHRRLFVKSALLLAWADGDVSALERGKIEELAGALGMRRDEVGRLEDGVKDFLLGSLSHLHNTDATRKVAGKLKI